MTDHNSEKFIQTLFSIIDFYFLIIMALYIWIIHGFLKFEGLPIDVSRFVYLLIWISLIKTGLDMKFIDFSEISREHFETYGKELKGFSGRSVITKQKITIMGSIFLISSLIPFSQIILQKGMGISSQFLFILLLFLFLLILQKTHYLKFYSEIIDSILLSLIIPVLGLTTQNYDREFSKFILTTFPFFLQIFAFFILQNIRKMGKDNYFQISGILTALDMIIVLKIICALSISGGLLLIILPQFGLGLDLTPAVYFSLIPVLIFIFFINSTIVIGKKYFKFAYIFMQVIIGMNILILLAKLY